MITSTTSALPIQPGFAAPAAAGRTPVPSAEPRDQVGSALPLDLSISLRRSAPPAESTTAPADSCETRPSAPRSLNGNAAGPQNRLTSLGQLEGQTLYVGQNGLLVAMEETSPLAGAPEMRVPAREPLSRSGQAAGLSTAPQGLPDLVTRYFTAEEFHTLNSGHYHNAEHPVAVAEAAAGLARGLGYDQRRTAFLEQCALLHDADERIQPRTGEVKTGTPARAQVTLHWMDQNQPQLSQRMGWSREDFLEARALIARTDFPFDEKPRTPGTPYDGKSPVQVYRECLEQLPPERRAQAMKDGLVLRFADQTGFYVGSFEMATRSVEGLTRELQGTGAPVQLPGMLKSTPTFMDSAGTDLEHDRKLAAELGVRAELPTREQLLAAYPASMRESLERNRAGFAALGG